MKFKNLFGFGKLTALGFTQEDAQGHETSGSISVCHPHLRPLPGYGAASNKGSISGMGKNLNKAGYTASGAPKHPYKRVNEKA